MQLIRLTIPDVVQIEPKVFEDDRGFFFEAWNERGFGEAGIKARFVQDNHSGSRRGTLRGLHYQIKQSQGKLVRVIRGEVFDVAVDVRRDSPTFGRWVGATITAENRRMMWVPPGFAHGFLVLSDYAEFLYKCTDYYAPQYERTIRWDDPELAIDWPLAPGQAPLLSPKDAAGVAFSEAEFQ
ncbi:MAG: dTDP-4-dehydrorhamnose 3,5-epimerase [Pseudomonadota bacterium]|nr:dTDP-4-dehydrorhamnose 3,5-epimerase [Pseudomonadota bacterium]